VVFKYASLNKLSIREAGLNILNDGKALETCVEVFK
jgi:hypothetical protein